MRAPAPGGPTSTTTTLGTMTVGCSTSVDDAVRAASELTRLNAGGPVMMAEAYAATRRAYMKRSAHQRA